MTIEQMQTASIEELEAFLDDRMCASETCSNLCMREYIYCERCMYGAPEKGSVEQIAAKQLLLMLRNKEKKGN